jgi:predicted phosphodiesterase
MGRASRAATTHERIFVVGHEPAYPQPDVDNGRLRHETDSLNAYVAHRDRFWDLLKGKGVVAYICGHTHNYSLVKIDGVWQLDAGHGRGLGDTGAPSTFSLIHVDGPIVTYETYRDAASGGSYTLMYAGLLEGLPTFLPVVAN